LILVRSVLATFFFEIHRCLNLQRVAVVLVLSLFPPAMIAAIGLSGRAHANPIPMSDFLIVVLVGIVGILAQLLWATSAVHSELEGKSWIFLASRPRGRISLFLGKYLAAVAFSFAVCLLAASGCLIVRTYVAKTMVNPIDTWLAMNATSLVSCLTYSAIFSCIGTFSQKRAMVFSAGYFILSEMILANVPAIISQFTARFHLQSIAAEWIGWFYPIGEQEYHELYGKFSLGFHLTCVFAGIVGLLVAGCWIVSSRQYLTDEE
jgi:ABC-type transport system involved in multi-copper enzyme maturation permease subunit